MRVDVFQVGEAGLVLGRAMHCDAVHAFFGGRGRGEDEPNRKYQARDGGNAHVGQTSTLGCRDPAPVLVCWAPEAGGAHDERGKGLRSGSAASVSSWSLSSSGFLISPLFIDEVVDGAFPGPEALAAMSDEEKEKMRDAVTEAARSAPDKEMAEAMPEEGAGPVQLATGSFKGCR